LARSLSLRAYVALWVSSLLASFLVLVAALYMTQDRIRQMRVRLVSDAQALDDGRRLELSLVHQAREDLLFRLPGDESHEAARDAALQAAAATAATLITEGIPPDELQLVEEIREKISLFLPLVLGSGRPEPADVRSRADELADLARRYIKRNQGDMAATMRSALYLQAKVTHWFVAAVILVAIVLAAGSLSLLSRVVRPTLELTRVARRIGRGDLAARARAARDDELGELARTFNNMAQDIADREEARLDFVANVAHDLKNPLVVVGGAARHLRTCILEPSHQAVWLDRIIHQVNRLENLIHDLMDTVQVSTGRLSLEKTTLDLAGLVREIQREQAEQFSQHALLFEGEDECWVSADRDRLERVAINLISNAVKYSPEGTEVVLKVVRRNAVAVFTVEDRGAGISPDDLEVIFQPFGRGRQTRSMARGMGLGLCVVKDILQAHGGSIEVRSTVGVGTTVEVTLPLTEERPGVAGEGSGQSGTP